MSHIYYHMIKIKLSKKLFFLFLVLVVAVCVSMYDAKIELVVFVLSLTGCGCDRYDCISRCQCVIYQAAKAAKTRLMCPNTQPLHRPVNTQSLNVLTYSKFQFNAGLRLRMVLAKQ